MPAQEARIKVIGAADAGPDDEHDLLALVEVGNRIGAQRRSRKGRDQHARHRASQHRRVPIEPIGVSAPLKFVSRSR
jgi:hypothetical protein